MCEVCEQAPASVTCKADAAALCVTCDNDIHSANPLARRHERVPVEPFYDSTVSLIKSSQFTLLDESNHTHNNGPDLISVHEPDSWLLPPHPIPILNTKIGFDINNNGEIKAAAAAAAAVTGDFFFSEMEPFMDLDYPNSFQQHNLGTTDSVVPVQTKSMAAGIPMMNNENCFDIDLCRNKLSDFSYNNHQSLSQSIESSSLDVGVVPDGNSNSMSDISYPFGRSAITGVPAVGTTTTTQATQLYGSDRKSRVMRYREKRKNRKFEKTIRYASRKAYAETRPRIKGRFAKRTEMDSGLDQLYGSNSVSSFMDFQFGVVPSF
jgi:hypothetical protein